jgi:hypothetical protein
MMATEAKEAVATADESNKFKVGRAASSLSLYFFRGR